jgi:hypothetical protein
VAGSEKGTIFNEVKMKIYQNDQWRVLLHIFPTEKEALDYQLKPKRKT